MRVPKLSFAYDGRADSSSTFVDISTDKIVGIVEKAATSLPC